MPHVAAAARAPLRLRATLGELGSGLATTATLGHGAPNIRPRVEEGAVDRSRRGVDPTWSALEGVEAAVGVPEAGDASRRLAVGGGVVLGEVQVRGNTLQAFCGDERRSSLRSSISKTQFSREARGAPCAVASAGSRSACVSAITARNSARTTECKKGMVKGASRLSKRPTAARALACWSSTVMRSSMLRRVADVMQPLSRIGKYSSSRNISRPALKRRASARSRFLFSFLPTESWTSQAPGATLSGESKSSLHRWPAGRSERPEARSSEPKRGRPEPSGRRSL